MSEITKNIKAKTFCNKYNGNDKTLFLKSVQRKRRNITYSELITPRVSDSAFGTIIILVRAVAPTGAAEGQGAVLPPCRHWKPLTPISAICPMHCKFRADLVLSKEANYSGFRRRHVVLWPVNVGGWGSTVEYRATNCKTKCTGNSITLKLCARKQWPLTAHEHKVTIGQNQPFLMEQSDWRKDAWEQINIHIKHKASPGSVTPGIFVCLAPIWK